MTGHIIGPRNVLDRPLMSGDAGVVLEPDGNFLLFNMHEDITRDLTPAQAAQGRKLRAIAVLLSVPELMSIVDEFAADPALSDAYIGTLTPEQRRKLS